jgi:hypothetical protein
VIAMMMMKGARQSGERRDSTRSSGWQFQQESSSTHKALPAICRFLVVNKTRVHIHRKFTVPTSHRRKNDYRILYHQHPFHSMTPLLFACIFNDSIKGSSERMSNAIEFVCGA